MKTEKKLNIILIIATISLIIYSTIITVQFISLGNKYTTLTNTLMEYLEFDRFNDRPVVGAEVIGILDSYKNKDFSIVVKSIKNQQYFNYGTLLKNTNSNNIIELPNNDYSYYEGLSTTNERNENISNIDNFDSNEYIGVALKYNAKLIKDDSKKIIGICFERVEK